MQDSALARWQRQALAILMAVLAVGLVASSPASAADTSGFQAKLRLTSSQPSTPSGAILNLIRPDLPSGKAKSEAVGVFQLPEGTKISSTAVPACTKDDTTWQIEGPFACPDSFIGTGLVKIDTGFGPPVDPLLLDQQWYYAPSQIVSLITQHGTTVPVLRVLRVDIKDATFTAKLTNLPPGWPPGTTWAPKETDLTLNKVVTARGAFITTPPSCPPSGQWITTVTLTYDNGTTDKISDGTPCDRAHGSRAGSADHRRTYSGRRHRDGHRHHGRRRS